MNRFRAIMCVLVAMVFLSGGAGARAKKWTKASIPTHTIRLHEGVLTFPPPVWMDEVKAVGGLKSHRDQYDNYYTLEQIPRNQEFDNWTRLYGVYGYHLPEYDMERFLDESANVLALGCREPAKFRVVSAGKDSMILTFYCSGLKAPCGSGGNDSESGLLYVSQVGHSFAKVYMGWRAPCEKVTGSGGWYNRQQVTEALGRLKEVRYSKAGQ